jgi:hypothetical protein
MPGFRHARPEEKWHGIGRLTLELATS